MIMSVIQVGLVDTTGALDSALVNAAAAALNIQVMRDLPQFWNPKSLDGERSLIAYQPSEHRQFCGKNYRMCRAG
jgi:hypothetical protein